MKSLILTCALALMVLSIGATEDAQAFRCRVSDVEVTCGSCSRTITWEAISMVAGATYTIERKIASGSWMTIASGLPDTPGSSESYVDNGIVPGTGSITYQYRVTSDCGGGGKTESGTSAPVSCSCS